mmetsp:Transcript_33942/g.75267  ORF Transcript_33942/g.75267 Transcript_33942/m.75267 type:complete len:215 (-) Transcript_33942:264-908(-)
MLDGRGILLLLLLLLVPCVLLHGGGVMLLLLQPLQLLQHTISLLLLVHFMVLHRGRFVMLLLQLLQLLKHDISLLLLLLACCLLRLPFGLSCMPSPRRVRTTSSGLLLRRQLLVREPFLMRDLSFITALQLRLLLFLIRCLVHSLLRCLHQHLLWRLLLRWRVLLLSLLRCQLVAQVLLSVSLIFVRDLCIMCSNVLIQGSICLTIRTSCSNWT